MNENTTQQTTAELGKELERERALRKQHEEEARTARLELLEALASLEKYRRMPAKLDKYIHRSHKLKRERNLYGAVCLVMVLVLTYFFIERYQKAREIETMKNNMKAATQPKKVLPGIITQEAMERDAEAQGGSVIFEEE